jgi:hypothetical protein
MIWLEERLNDGVKLPAPEELLALEELLAPKEPLESEYLSLPEVGVDSGPLSALAVGCVVFCAGKGESSV